MAQWIRSNGVLIDVTPARGALFSLAELQAMVGGYIEVLRVAEGYLVINEDGRRLQLPYNRDATRLWTAEVVTRAAAAGVVSRATGYFIVGDAVLCSTTEID